MMIAFAAVFLALITYWLHRRLVRATALARPWSLVVDATLIVLWVLAVIGVGAGRILDPAWARAPAYIGLVWLAVVLYLVLGLGLVALTSAIARLIRWAQPGPTGTTFRHRRLLALRVSTALVAIAAVAVTAYGVTEAATPKVTETNVALPDLPAEFNGTKVALISDLHVGPARGGAFTQKVVDLVNAQRPDLIVIAGDLTDGTVAEVGADLRPLADLSAPLGIYGVSGNHEFYADDGGQWLDEWQRLGVHTLRNQRSTITRAGASIDIVGIQDYSAPTPYQPNLAMALDGADADRFTLLLAHEPRQAFEASDRGVDLQVSGHTHGGQIWPIRYLVPLQQPSVQGLDKVGSTVLYTTRGAGAWGPPVRVGAPPEISILHLQRAAP